MVDDQISIEILLKQADLVIPRLERLTPDSSWAHQASGYRRGILSLIRRLSPYSGLEDDASLPPITKIDKGLLLKVLNKSFWILEEAAKDKID